VKTTLRDILENVYHRYPNMIVIHRTKLLYEVSLKECASGEVWHVEYKDGSEDKLGDAGGEEATVYVTDEVLTANIDERDRRIAALEAERDTLKKQLTDQQGELETRAGILNLAVTAAKSHGFKQNGWIDSIDYLTKLALYLRETRIVLSEALIEGLQPGEEFGAAKRLVEKRNSDREAIKAQVMQRKELETIITTLYGRLRGFAANGLYSLPVQDDHMQKAWKIWQQHESTTEHPDESA
jgi:hypothetical protein